MTQVLMNAYLFTFCCHGRVNSVASITVKFIIFIGIH